MKACSTYLLPQTEHNASAHRRCVAATYHGHHSRASPVLHSHAPRAAPCPCWPDGKSRTAAAQPHSFALGQGQPFSSPASFLSDGDHHAWLLHHLTPGLSSPGEASSAPPMPGVRALQESWFLCFRSERLNEQIFIASVALVEVGIVSARVHAGVHVLDSRIDRFPFS